ncbi:protein TolR [Inmirania thermothiophila]|uniref:Tol-Pal system protein TolR n=1 Tax=Inmirania thermothiophila TaxID=1750597 RepID=A0A3N1XXY9_9GAMM|nr:protein TolR [Inmirania thermothiophila]ROR29797.1 biopolymer transport protein TolR [Inmirania thermothiophila]
MSTPPRRTRRRPMAEINVVPYIDVMLVLLVIFIITAPLLTQGVQVELPAAASEPLPRREAEPLILTVDAEGRMYLNVGDGAERPLEAQTLMARAAAVLRRRPQTPVLVRADRRVPYGAVVRAMVLLQRAGAPSVGLMTEPPETGS